MQPDNVSRQSITLMACTMMPLRFLTNFRHLQLSICTGGSQQEGKKQHVSLQKNNKKKQREYLCFVSKLPAFHRFYFLFSSASEHSDETTSPASVQPTGHPDISISSARSLCSGSFDLFLSGCLHFHYLPCFFLLSLSLSFTIVHPPFSSHPAS